MTDKFDMYIQGIPISEYEQGRFLGFGQDPAIAARGIHKMVSRFIMCMFTPKGSNLSDAEYGTTLASALGGTFDPTTLHTLAVESVNDAVSKIQEYDSEYDLDDDERLASAELITLALDEEAPGIRFRVRLKNAAGTTVSAYLASAAEG